MGGRSHWSNIGGESGWMGIPLTERVDMGAPRKRFFLVKPRGGMPETERTVLLCHEKE